jgi:hypothetical protein
MAANTKVHFGMWKDLHKTHSNKDNNTGEELRNKDRRLTTDEC